MSWLLIFAAIAVAIIDWLTATPKPNEPKWPRWARFFCAIVVASVGVIGLTKGYFDRAAGITAYKERRLAVAIEKLSSAHASPFKNRQVIDYLGLAYKNVADRAVDSPVAKEYYEKALEYVLESRMRYPNSPYAKNTMINIYRRTKRWKELIPLANSFRSELETDFLRSDGKSLSNELRASFLVTLGNISADQDNPDRSDMDAVGLYRLAQELNPTNSSVVLNMPPRLIDLADKMQVDSKERYQLLEEALKLSVAGLDLDEPRDKVFSVLSIIEILMMKNAPQVPIPGYTLSEALRVVEVNKTAQQDFDLEVWFVLTEAYLTMGELNKARKTLDQALIYQARFTQEQEKWVESLKKGIIQNKSTQPTTGAASD